MCPHGVRVSRSAPAESPTPVCRGAGARSPPSPCSEGIRPRRPARPAARPSTSVQGSGREWPECGASPRCPRHDRSGSTSGCQSLARRNRSGSRAPRLCAGDRAAAPRAPARTGRHTCRRPGDFEAPRLRPPRPDHR